MEDHHSSSTNRGTTSEAEAADIVREFSAYVDINWLTLRLNVLARHPESWMRYIRRAVYYRWVAHLRRGRPNLASPVSRSLARVRLLAIAHEFDFSSRDLELLNHIYYHCFSVAETAIMFDVAHEELVQRLRPLLAAMRGA